MFCTIIPRKWKTGLVPVYINVYDLTPINGYAYWFGLGIYHSGVQGQNPFSLNFFLKPGLNFRPSSAFWWPEAVVFIVFGLVNKDRWGFASDFLLSWVVLLFHCLGLFLFSLDGAF